jgi:Type VI secretion system protein DotU
MTEPIERPQSVPSDMPQRTPEREPLPVPVDAQMAVQQLRDAGFSEDQQAALTTALLRVLALWTQQATRGDLQTELHAGEQRLAQQLDALREEIRREVVQHTTALREELQSEFARHADLLHTTRAQPARKRDVPLWFITALLVLTCAGVFLLVGRSMLGW